jgi:hypothetical protein
MMKPEPRLHHYCQNIVKGHLHDIIEMYRLFDLDIVFDPGADAGWIMLGQKQLRFAIQVAEVLEAPIVDLYIKIRSHVAFISDDPDRLIAKVEKWANDRGIKFRKGGWSKIERFFDLPDIFVNFVVEVMHTSIETK